MHDYLAVEQFIRGTRIFIFHLFSVLRQRSTVQQITAPAKIVPIKGLPLPF